MNSFQLRNMTNVEHILRLEQLLAHRGNQIGPAGKHTNVVGMLREQTDRLFHGTRPQQQLEFRKAQSSPPISAVAFCRAGSSGCRSGPLPRNHSAPPCSRKRVGAVGSTPSVRLIGLAFF